jgi:hypothetical protein
MNCFEAQEKIIDLILGELDYEDEILLKEHLSTCPICSDDFEFLNRCLHICTGREDETCEYQFKENYWDEFVVSVHEQIEHEKIERKFPFKVIIPIAAAALIGVVVGYYFFIQPAPQETVKETLPDYERHDPYDEVYELTPEQREEFIRMINQRYGEE